MRCPRTFSSCADATYQVGIRCIWRFGKTRRTVLTIGLLLVLVGLFILDQGPTVLGPFAESVGLATRVPIQRTIIASTLLPVPPGNYSFLRVDLQSHVHAAGSLQVADGREIAFYVMDEGNFSNWRAGRLTTIILAMPLTSSYNFNFTSTSEGSYYFVFDNHDTSRRVVIFSLSSIEQTVVLAPAITYAGPEALLLAALLIILGIKTGKKKPKPEPEKREAMGWKCEFCGAENTAAEVFCKNCGRSRD